MQFPYTKLIVSDFVAILTLDHPEVLNAISIEMLSGINQALDAIHEKQKEIRCLVITGAGKAFSAGANLQGEDPASNLVLHDPGRALEIAFHPILRRLRDLHCPIVSAVNGVAAGSGMSFALMGDIVICARSSYFLQAFRRIGLVSDCGASWILPRLVGKARAIELSLLGERLPADNALEWGMVNRVVDDSDLSNIVSDVARDLANGPTVALSLIRRLYWETQHNSYEEQLDLERRLQQIAAKSNDFKEGVSAFLEKRPAVFSGT